MVRHAKLQLQLTYAYIVDRNYALPVANRIEKFLADNIRWQQLVFKKRHILPDPNAVSNGAVSTQNTRWSCTV